MGACGFGHWLLLLVVAGSDLCGLLAQPLRQFALVGIVRLFFSAQSFSRTNVLSVVRTNKALFF